MPSNKLKKNILKKKSKYSSKKNWSNQRKNLQKPEEEHITLDLDINKDSIEFFSKNATFDQHYDAQLLNRAKYLATLIAFDDHSIDLLPNTRSRALAAAFARNDVEFIAYFLDNNKKFGFVDVLKAVNILDSQRQKKAIEKKMERIAKSGAIIKKKKMTEFKKNIQNLEILKPKVGSFSGASAKKVRKWVRKFDVKDLEFFAICLPTEPWKKLADLCHFNPEKDFTSAPWFLPYCFGKNPPVGSKVDKCRHMNGENVNQLIAEFDLPYRIVKNYKDFLNNDSKKILAEKQEKLDSILWNYEDLHCPEVDDIIRARLEKGERVELGYGKLMERLILFNDYNSKNLITEKNSLFSLLIPIAEKNLKTFKSTLASPVAVLGDASSSMDVAIRTSTIISSLLATICEAKLSFFKHENFESKLKKLKDIKDVLQVACDTKASGSTSPAASLVPYFDRKEIIKSFIIVTDEEENTKAKTKDGRTWNFFPLFMEYRKTVYPASLIFVSFLNQQHSTGQMYRDFLRENVVDVMQFKFCRSRPDLTKLDSILGKICSKSSRNFAGHVENIESSLRLNGLTNFIREMNLNS